MMSFGKQVRKFRTRRQYSMLSLAYRANISQSTLSGIELDKRLPDLGTVLALARELRASFVFDSGGTPIVVTAHGFTVTKHRVKLDEDDDEPEAGDSAEVSEDV